MDVLIGRTGVARDRIPAADRPGVPSPGTRALPGRGLTRAKVSGIPLAHLAEMHRGGQRMMLPTGTHCPGALGGTAVGRSTRRAARPGHRSHGRRPLRTVAALSGSWNTPSPTTLDTPRRKPISRRRTGLPDTRHRGEGPLPSNKPGQLPSLSSLPRKRRTTVILLGVVAHTTRARSDPRANPRSRVAADRRDGATMTMAR